MPIGSDAQYSPAGITDWSSYGVFPEENFVFNNPAAPLTPIRKSTDLWTGRSRCTPDNPSSSPLVTLPLPSFVVPGASSGNTPNSAAAIITADGGSYVQTQPLTHCTSSSPWTTGFVEPTVSIYGAGITGAQGGSHLSSIGGTIRVGDWALARSAGVFPHTLKTVLGSQNYSASAGPGCNVAGCRWPAISSDCNTACGYSGSNSQVKMGTLLALPPAYNCGAMRTEPGRIICQTFKDRGAYIVDSGWDTGSPAYLPVEHGPAGSPETEFASLFGFGMFTSNPNTSWALDWRDIITDAQVVMNNGPTTVGGGGTPRLPLSPPISN